MEMNFSWFGRDDADMNDQGITNFTSIKKFYPISRIGHGSRTDESILRSVVSVYEMGSRNLLQLLPIMFYFHWKLMKMNRLERRKIVHGNLL